LRSRRTLTLGHGLSVSRRPQKREINPFFKGEKGEYSF
jgi:hypothetical protein